MIILEIIGGIVLFLILLAVGFYLFLKYKFGKWLKIDSDKNYSPLSIHLNEDLFPKWLDEPKTKQMISKLKEHGFQPSKSFSIPEMEEVQLLSLIKEPHFAVLYTHEIAGSWVEFVAISEEGREFNVSNVPLGSGMSSHPNITKVHLKGAECDEMLAEYYKLLEGENLKAIHEDGFRAFFEESYEKDIKWKNRRGGVTYEEFLKTEKEFPGKYKDNQLKEAFIELKIQELDQWHTSVLDQYEESGKLDAEELNDLRCDSIIVPEITDPVSYAHYLKENGFINDNINLDKLVTHFEGETDVSKIFKMLNSKRSPDLRAIKEASFDHPLPIELYRIPESSNYSEARTQFH